MSINDIIAEREWEISNGARESDDEVRSATGNVFPRRLPFNEGSRCNNISRDDEKTY